MARPQAPTSTTEEAGFALHTERLGPLPLINHFIERIGLHQTLSRFVPADRRCTITHASALGVLLRSIIVEREPIYRQHETVHGFADGMFGISAQEMEHLSDDRLGRALDRLFDADRTALLTELVLAVGQRFGVRFDEFHNDSTSVSFCGSYRGARGRQIRARTGPAITYGHSKAHRPDLKQLLFILTMSADGMPAVHKLREDFGIERMVMVGDRGMVSQKAIAELRETDGVGWITALKSVSIRALVEQGQLQMGLFDQRNLLELSSPDYPGERLVACRNDALAKLRAHKREDLLVATEQSLQAIQVRVEAGKLKGQDAIGVRVGRIINRYKVAKHFELHITDASLAWARKADSIASEAALDGLYIIRTCVPAEQMDAPQCVRSYKALANVERAFRSIKTIDLKVRPIHHRLADRVRAHIFLCMLAYYVEWHMREAWRELTFADTELQDKATRDPVAPAKRSGKALAKAKSHALEDSTPVHSFSTLMADLAAVVRNTCTTPGARADAPTFEITTTANANQLRAFALIQAIKA